MHALIDADSLVYSAAFSAQTKDTQGSVVPLGEGLAIHYLDSSVEDIVNLFDDFDLYLTPDITFRSHISRYKQGRSRRPYHYQTLRNRLTEHWGASMWDNIEADDILSIQGWKAFREGRDDVVMVSIDKDLDQVPGKHYNFRKCQFYYLTEEEANYNFWVQMLMGDQADNIQGIPGCGKKNAEKILNESEDWESTVREIYAIGRHDYETTYKMLRLLE